MKDDKKDFEDIGINKRRTDRIYFESPNVQTIYNRMEFIKNENKSLLKRIYSTELKQKIDSIDVEELREESINNIYDFIDDVLQIKDGYIYNTELPEFIKDYSNNMKFALNRDKTYILKAKRKLKSDNYGSSVRAIELCDKAIEVNYFNWEAYYLKGIALINIDKYDDAIDQLIKSLALNEDNLDARLHIAFAYLFKIEYSKAIALFDSVLKVDENSFDALKGKAYTYYYWEKYDKADEFFKKANSIKILDDDSKDMWDVCLEKL